MVRKSILSARPESLLAIVSSILTDADVFRGEHQKVLSVVAFLNKPVEPSELLNLVVDTISNSACSTGEIGTE